ncbi:hypothetical protein RG181_003568 [Acinetobacter baumannii]
MSKNGTTRSNDAITCTL